MDINISINLHLAVLANTFLAAKVVFSGNLSEFVSVTFC